MFKKISILLLTLSLSWLAYGGSYSSGSKSSSPSRSSSGSSSRSYSSSSSGKSYSSNKSSPPSSKPSSSSSSSSKSSFFGKAEKAQARQDSKATFEKYKASQQSYDYLKSQPKESYSTRPTRQQTVFKTYYSQPQAQAPQVIYKDSTWNPFFWMWLLDRPNQQAAWVYNHRSEISDERYKELVAKNKDLEVQIKALEDKKEVKDPSYAPKEIDKDLMYSDDYVKAVQEPKDDSDFNWLLWLVILPSSLGILGLSIYAIFFKKRDF